MKSRILAVLAGAAAILMSGCAGNTTRSNAIEVFPDMDRQDKYKPQTRSAYFGDKRSSRMPVPGTVARGYLKEDEVFNVGIVNKMYVGRNPLAIDAALLKHGQARFNTYCSPCHDRTGQGQGLVGQRSLWLPTNLQEDRVKTMVDGEIYDIASHGRRSMPGYRFQISERDRWAIVAYVRALQRTSGTAEDVPADLRSELR